MQKENLENNYDTDRLDTHAIQVDKNVAFTSASKSSVVSQTSGNSTCKEDVNTTDVKTLDICKDYVISEVNNVDKPSSINNETCKINSSENNKETMQDQDLKEGKIQTLTRSASDLSLGISMIVAVLLGFGVGYLLYKWLGYYWLIWVGLGYGVAAAILNVVKAYRRLYRDLDSLRHEEKYKYMQDKILEEREKEAR